MKTVSGLTAILLCALTLSGCGGGEGGGKVAQKVADPLINIIKDVFHFTAETHPAPSTLHDVSATLAEAIGSGQSIR
jgi:hypothetical protein